MRTIRGIRGATSAHENTKEAIYESTRVLMEHIIAENEIDVEDVASVFLTMTTDLNADFPARAVRSLNGWQWVPLMCATEIDVPGSLGKCIRILVHINTERTQAQLVHVYLGDALRLRPDISLRGPVKSGETAG